MITSEQRVTTQPIWPPIQHDGETDLGKQAQRNAEAESKRISDNIDKEIKLERLKRERETGPKVLLLGAPPGFNIHHFRLIQDFHLSGQAESGKSTVLKNFQILLAPKAFENEVSRNSERRYA
jgi:hypothetical protein